MRTVRTGTVATRISARIRGATAFGLFGPVLGAIGPACGQAEYDFVGSFNANPLAGEMRQSDINERGARSSSGAK